MITHTQHILLRSRILLAVVLVLCSTPAGICDAPARIPLVARIAYSRAIVIGEVTEVRELPAWNGNIVWHPNTEATVKISQALRGKTPDLVTVEIAVSEREPCQVGDGVILFISDLDQNAKAKVFEAAQGFCLLRSLKRRDNDPSSDPIIYRAIMQMILHEDHSQMPKRLYPARFGQKGIAVLLELAKSEKPNVRRFAIECLLDLPISEKTGEVLMAALQDKDGRVRETSAYALVYQKYAPAVKHLADYARSLPRTALRREIFRFLAEAAPQEYDYAGALEESLKSAEPSAHQTFRESLKLLPQRFYVWVAIDVDETGVISLVGHRPGIKPEEVQAFMAALTLPEAIKNNLVSFSCEIHIGYDHSTEVVKVYVW